MTWLKRAFISHLYFGLPSRQNTPTASQQRANTPHECPGYDTKQSDGDVPAVLKLWGMRSTPSLLSLPGPLWPGVVAPDKGLIYGSNRTNGILMLKWIVWLNWIAWNRNFLTIKPYLHINCVLMLNWIISNRTVFDIKTVFTLNWIVTYNCLTSLKWKCFWQLNSVLMLNWIVLNRTDYLHKMDLALNNLQRLICHKTQQNNQPS